MTKLIPHRLLLLLVAIAVTVASSRPTEAQGAAPAQRLTTRAQGLPGAQVPTPPPPIDADTGLPSGDLPRFDLFFEGGTPQQLVDTIREKTGILNAIIPSEHSQMHLPPMSMQQVNVEELFRALELASQRHLRIPHVQNGQKSYSSYTVGHGFRTGGPVAQVTPKSIWHFYAQPAPSEGALNNSKFFQLGPYLDPLTVEDITTAIQAGWKMLGETNTPALNYHKETKLLIAVGRPEQISMIESVLAELPKGEAFGYPPGMQSPFSNQGYIQSPGAANPTQTAPTSPATAPTNKTKQQL